AREAARRAQCTNNLKQIALAMHNYISANDTVPPTMVVYSPTPIGSNAGQSFSPLARLLPFLEQNQIFNAINFSVSERWGGATGSDIVSQMNGSTADCDTWGLINASATGNQITSFLCPSDTGLANLTGFIFVPGGTMQLVGRFNYPFNTGLNPWTSATGGALNGPAYFRGWNDRRPPGTPPGGPAYFTGLQADRPVTIASFTDGTSNTAVFSEWVRGDGIPPPNSANGLGQVYN